MSNFLVFYKRRFLCLKDDRLLQENGNKHLHTTRMNAAAARVDPAALPPLDDANLH